MRKTIIIASVLFDLVVASSLRADGRHPLAVRAEQSFFEALVDAPEKRDGAIRELMTAYAVDAKDARTSLLLGLAYLWSASDSADRDPMAIQHLVLSERFLARASKLDPKDGRIATWLVPARLILSGIDREPERSGELLAELREAYRKRPFFHSFSLGLVGAQSKPDSPAFREGLEALETVLSKRCPEEADRACLNAPHWPHNREGFVVFAAEYQARVGNLPRSKELLERAAQIPEYAAWPFKKDAEELNAAIESARAGDPTALKAHAKSSRAGSCRSCHGGR